MSAYAAVSNFSITGTCLFSHIHFPYFNFKKDGKKNQVRKGVFITFLLQVLTGTNLCCASSLTLNVSETGQKDMSFINELKNRNHWQITVF